LPQDVANRWVYYRVLRYDGSVQLAFQVAIYILGSKHVADEESTQSVTWGTACMQVEFLLVPLALRDEARIERSRFHRSNYEIAYGRSYPVGGQQIDWPRFTTPRPPTDTTDQ